MSQSPPKGKESPECGTPQQIQREGQQDLQNAERLLETNNVDAQTRTRGSVILNPHSFLNKYPNTVRPTNAQELTSRVSSAFLEESRRTSLAPSYKSFPIPATSDVLFATDTRRHASDEDLRPNPADQSSRTLDRSQVVNDQSSIFIDDAIQQDRNPPRVPSQFNSAAGYLGMPSQCRANHPVADDRPLRSAPANRSPATSDRLLFQVPLDSASSNTLPNTDSDAGNPAYFPDPTAARFEPPRAQHPKSPATPSTSYFEPPRAHHSRAAAPAFPPDPVFGAEQQARAAEKKLAQLQRLSQLTTSERNTPCSRLLTTKKDPSFAMFDPTASAERPVNGVRHLPKKPELTKEEINDLIQCEAIDIDSARVLFSDERKTYKKPCPKQQKAQMGVKSMVSSHVARSPNQCSDKEYAPMVEPDPDDLSPDVAAKLMFSQEAGVGLEACPSLTIRHLFPENRKRPVYYERRNKMSIFDLRDEEELMSKSSVVPDGGASDSAYSKKMKGKGEETSHKSCEGENCANQEKREYVLVAQKPVRFNRVQFRGDLPNWFPGYFAAFPDQSKSVAAVGSPSTVLNKAWLTTNPANIPSNDIVILES